jgi:hypothetical protein
MERISPTRIGVAVKFRFSLSSAADDLPPLQHLQPATPVQFRLGAALPHSNTPSLQYSITPSPRHTHKPIRPYADTPIRPLAASVLFDPGGDGFRQVFTGARLQYAGCFSRVRQKAAFDQHRG